MGHHNAGEEKFHDDIIDPATIPRLGWAAVHRHHHLHSDTEEDMHSPRHRGFLYSHVGWVFDRCHAETETESVPDLARYPDMPDGLAAVAAGFIERCALQVVMDSEHFDVDACMRPLHALSRCAKVL
jgi:hypothetical protein